LRRILGEAGKRARKIRKRLHHWTLKGSAAAEAYD